MNITFAEEYATVNTLADTKLPEFSFGIGQVVSWFLGEGVYSFSYEITRPMNLEFTAKAQNEPQDFAFNCIVDLGTLYQEGYVPAYPSQSFVGKNAPRDGQNRAVEVSDEGTVLKMQLKPDTSIATIAYFTSDMIVGLLWKYKAKSGKFYLSFNSYQISVDTGIDNKDLGKYMIDPSAGYDLHASVSKIKLK